MLIFTVILRVLTNKVLVKQEIYTGIYDQQFPSENLVSSYIDVFTVIIQTSSFNTTVNEEFTHFWNCTAAKGFLSTRS